LDTRLEDKPVQKTMVPDEPPLPLPSKEVGRHVLAFRKFSRFSLTPLNLRRWRNFKANRRGYWSLWVFLGLFLFSLFAEFIANDKPIIAVYKGEVLFPVLVDYPESKFGGFLAVTDYKDPVILDEIAQNGARRPGLKLTVEDDGPGIPEDRVEHLLKRGARGDERVQGHGIGLAIVQDILEAYKGQLIVSRSALLGGASFTLRFGPT